MLFASIIVVIGLSAAAALRMGIHPWHRLQLFRGLTTTLSCESSAELIFNENVPLNVRKRVYELENEKKNLEKELQLLIEKKNLEMQLLNETKDLEKKDLQLLNDKKDLEMQLLNEKKDLEMQLLNGKKDLEKKDLQLLIEKRDLEKKDLLFEVAEIKRLYEGAMKQLHNLNPRGVIGTL